MEQGTAARARSRVPWNWILGGAAIVLGAAFLLIPSYQGYRPRSLVTAAIEDAGPLKARVEAFHARHQRLPEGGEAADFRIDRGLKESRLVAWDAKERSVVVTLGDNMHRGKRFGFQAEASPSGIAWTCRGIDLESKYLPAACR